MKAVLKTLVIPLILVWWAVQLVIILVLALLKRFPLLCKIGDLLWLAGFLIWVVIAVVFAVVWVVGGWAIKKVWQKLRNIFKPVERTGWRLRTPGEIAARVHLHDFSAVVNEKGAAPDATPTVYDSERI